MIAKKQVFCGVAAVVFVVLAGCEEKGQGQSAGGAGEGAVEEGAGAATATMEVEGVGAEALAEILSEEDAPTVVDVRTEEEFAEGHIAGAVNIVFGEEGFAERLGELDREKPYVVHCRSGRRSTESLQTFEELGFQKIIHLEGGINDWVESGQPVEK